VTSNHLSLVIERWRSREDEWSRFRVQVDGAALAGEIVADLQRIIENDGGEGLTLRAASALSGYSTDHLSRLIREGVLPNAGRKGAPRICRADLPIKPKRVIATARNNGYDPNTDARSIGIRR
jgi:hypothetical protein